ncbi:hypothetical protein Trydic_g6387 [Trypoxylus dichotomus]
MQVALAPYWRPEYAKDISGLLPAIRQYFEEIKEFIRNPENEEIVRSFIDSHRNRFVTEENRYDVFPAQDVANMEFRRLNIATAVNFAFGNDLERADTTIELNPALAMTLLGVIGEGIIENTESYRSTEAAPVGFPIPYYLGSESIQESIEQLFRDFNRPIEPNRGDWYVLATKFFRRFLYIHPFQDGNGRVSRILLSILLMNYTVVPLCPFTWKRNSNEEFLRSLDEAHMYDNEELLRCFIIEAVHNNLEVCRQYFGLDAV